MSQITLNAVLPTRKLATVDGGQVTLPPWVLGDRAVCTLRVLDDPGNGTLKERTLNVRSLRASLGKVLEPASGGSFTLRIGSDSGSPGTDAIAFNATTAAFTTAAAAELTAGGFTLVSISSPAAGCWVLQITGPGDEPQNVELLTNALAPESFVRIRAFEQAGLWYHEVRTIQAPLAFTGSFERVLPPPPTVTEVRAGGVSGSAEINELQALHLPPDFKGTYTLQFQFRTTRLLGIQDGPDEVAAALNALWSDGKVRFKASNPEVDYAYIEFVGLLGAATQPLITATVHSFAPGPITFTLDLTHAALATALRTDASAKFPFEIEVEVVEDGEDPEDTEVAGEFLTLCQQEITVVREQIFEELAEIPAINYLKPALPRSYRPFTPNQVITGVQHYVDVLGDDEALSFSIAHGLDTSAFHVSLRENKNNGRFLVHGGEYELTTGDVDAAELIVDCGFAPAEDSLAIVISSAGPISAFVNDLTVTQGQVVGLDDLLAVFGARLATIEDKLPYTTPGVAASTDEAQAVIDLPEKYESFFGTFEIGTASTKAPKLIRAGALLPAVHDTTVGAATIPFPAASSNAGQVVQNQSGSAVFVGGGYGRKGSYLPNNGFAACDGRTWYPAHREGTTRSYYPADCERSLFLFAVHDRMLRPGGAISIEFTLGLQLLGANTNAQWLLVIETGTAPQATGTSPAIGVNLSDVTWSGTLLAQRLVITGNREEAIFGCAIRRSLANAFAADRLLYNVWEAATDGVPASANFVLRARLIEFDVEDAVTAPRGAVAYSFTGGKVTLN